MTILENYISIQIINSFFVPRSAFIFRFQIGFLIVPGCHPRPPEMSAILVVSLTSVVCTHVYIGALQHFFMFPQVLWWCR